MTSTPRWQRLRAVVEEQFRGDAVMFLGAGVTAFVEALLQRGRRGRRQRGRRPRSSELAAVSTEPDFVLFDIALLRLRALLARARGDEASYRDLAQRYRETAASYGFEGHLALAKVL